MIINKPESVIENETHKIRSNFMIETYLSKKTRPNVN